MSIRIGLIVNPIAGIGGAVGLKGSDSLQVQQLAFERGAQSQSHLRARHALEILDPWKTDLVIITPPGLMGEDVARQCGYTPQVLYNLTCFSASNPIGLTSAEDTRVTAMAMRSMPVDLLLFAGGDGTARDVYSAIGEDFPALGIPAGVKIYSAAFATHPRHAGELAAAMLQGERMQFRSSEVIDLDEDAYRAGHVTTRLYGYLKIPYRPRLVQNQKVPSPTSESARLDAIAAGVIDMMKPGWLYILGPGTTTRAIAARLGFPKTLVGVDVYTLDGPLELDVSEARLLALLENRPAWIIVTPIGGQGFIFGRGNQPISPQVISKVGREHVLVVSLSEKLNELRGEPLLVDTGHPTVDQLLSGYLPVLVGYRDQVIYRVAS